MTSDQLRPISGHTTVDDTRDVRREVVIYIGNMHCASCASSIRTMISSLNTSLSSEVIRDIRASLPERNVSFTYPVMRHRDPNLDNVESQTKTSEDADILNLVYDELESNGFEITRTSTGAVRPRQSGLRGVLSRIRTSYNGIRGAYRQAGRDRLASIRAHLKVCEACRSDNRTLGETKIEEKDTGSNSDDAPLDLGPKDGADERVWVESKFMIEGMTCSSCVMTIQESLSPESNPAVQSATVTLFPALATVVHETSSLSADAVKEIIEDGGYGAELFESIPILGLNSKSATNSQQISGEDGQPVPRPKRIVKVLIQGMVAADDSNRVEEAFTKLKHEFPESAFEFRPISPSAPSVSLSYTPSSAKGLTLRTIRSAVESLGLQLSVDREESMEDQGRRAQRKEEQRVLIRFAISIIFAIPTFIIAVVGMSLVSGNSSFGRFWNKPVWGDATRGTISLFALATPVQFGVGSYFYIHSWQSLCGVWRKRQGKNWRAVWFARLFRWGSMDTLVALGTSMAYFASLAYMALDITRPTSTGTATMSYFDTSVFLMFFILAGRYLDVKARGKTGEAITELGKIRPTTGLLYSDQNAKAESSARTEEVEVDFLEVGDVLLVPVGSSPPLDCVLSSSSAQTSFDEASLTGESRPVVKNPGDTIFTGTINAGPSAAIVVVESEQGASVIDSILRAVQGALGRKAGIEKLADQVTAYFVPAIVGLACTTFVVWLVIGYLGDLPMSWLGDERRGSWTLFAVQFGVAVLLTGCPCGIGLAAPTAQMVGVGLAAKQGILVRGVDTFHAFRKVSTIVFDKTGTLTTSEFKVRHMELLKPEFDDEHFSSTFWKLLVAVEESSTHPISIGLRKFCADKQVSSDRTNNIQVVSSDELPGRGLVVAVDLDSSKRLEMIVGNKVLMDENDATYITDMAMEKTHGLVSRWQDEGNSIVYVASRFSNAADDDDDAKFGIGRFQILAVFALYDPPRPEAQYTIEQLRMSGISSYMVSGDNEKTARAIAALVGIDQDKVIAGVLPLGKRDWIERLQQRAGPIEKTWWGRRNAPKQNLVAFVGDGINDAPAIAQADAGISMGTAAAVAISTSDFCLLSSSLLSLLTLRSLARATVRKIITNFLWAFVYNASLLPLAAGCFYAINDKRVRLPPVWASLAMALSSTSVMMNSLLLKWLYRPPRPVTEWNKGRV